MTELRPVKATILDDDKFALLAIPFGGPIPSSKSPRGVDLDGEWFSERTDIKADWFNVRLVDWHHGADGLMKRAVIGKADNLRMDEDGWWVDVWLQHGERRLDLIRRLAERGGQLFGSSESVAGMVKKATTGEITVWPYVRQTLSTSPQNTLSVLRPLKAAVLDSEPTDAFWTEIEGHMRDLSTDLRDTGAKAGRDAGTDHQLNTQLRSFGDGIDRLHALVAQPAGDQSGE